MFDFLADKFSSAFAYISGNRYLTEKNLQETIQKVEQALIQSDVPYHVVQTFIDEIKQEVLGRKVLKSLKPAEQFANIVYEKMVNFLGGVTQEFVIKEPSLTMVVGLQGSGKTTTIAKLAHAVAQEQGKKDSILLGSVDFYRPAAIDQLEVLSSQAGLSFYRASSSNPLQAAQEIVAYARSHKKATVFIDTAGRLHVDEKMLQELSSLRTVLSPTYTLLVLDSMTGQESLRVAQEFEKITQITGAILTKMDSETRAGGAFAFGYMLKKPILFLGTGEKLDDLEPFRADRVASRMLGMGDVQTLIEKAEKKISVLEQQESEKAFKDGKFTLNDFAKQMDMMNRLGSFSQVASYIPGIKAQAIGKDQLTRAEKELVKFRAILGSMNAKELLDHKLLDKSRKARVAQGAGVKVSDIDDLLKRFEEMQRFAKLLKSMGKF